ncbi:hypothetical protein [Flavobacteriaceae bacterium 14752]|uniref:hypothetical protein n=1 Tax=Mesohalobacter salilacus TaxID=2491711 RepID=UPI000F63E5C7|nr:hypothetical protein EIG84_05920 [Flavobacteriaceae bacterium 14752]
MIHTIFQIEQAGNKLLDYGILGVVLLFIGFFAWKMYQKINADQEVWRSEAIQSRKDLIELSVKQNELNSKLVDIREKDVEQNKDNHNNIKRHLERLPEEVAKEVKINLTSSRT